MQKITSTIIKLISRRRRINATSTSRTTTKHRLMIRDLTTSSRRLGVKRVGVSGRSRRSGIRGVKPGVVASCDGCGYSCRRVDRVEDRVLTAAAKLLHLALWWWREGCRWLLLLLLLLVVLLHDEVESRVGRWTRCHLRGCCCLAEEAAELARVLVRRRRGSE